MLLSNRVKIIIGLISKTLVAKFEPAFCFGVSKNKYVKAAAKLASMDRKYEQIRLCASL